MLGLAVAAGLVMSGIAVAAPAEAAPLPVTGGTLDWGVKESFRTYIATIAAGTVELTDGATLNGNGTYRFPGVAGGSYDGATGDAAASFGGKVRFTGHHGALDLSITSPRVDIGGVKDVLRADVVSKSLSTGEVTSYPNVALVELNLTGVTPTTGANSVTYTGVPTTLLDTGAAAFAGFYGAGTAFDPVTFTLELETPPPPPADGLTWKVSQHAWTSSSLAPSHLATPPATKDTDDGFVFPIDTVVRDASTGQTAVSFAGALTLGNVAQGGYRITLANPEVLVDADGNGELVADLTYCVSAAACQVLPWPAVHDVTVVTFTVADEDVNDADDHLTWTFTPNYTNDQFAEEFVNALPNSLRSHFRNSGSPSDPNKPPAPVTVRFDDTPESAGVDVAATKLSGTIKPTSSKMNFTLTAANTGTSDRTITAADIDANITVEGNPVAAGDVVVAPATKVVKPGKTAAFKVTWSPNATPLQPGQHIEVELCARAAGDVQPFDNCQTLSSGNAAVHVTTSVPAPKVKASNTSNTLKVTVLNNGTESVSPLRPGDVSLTVTVDGAPVGTITPPSGGAKELKAGKSTSYSFKWTHPTLAPGAVVSVTGCVAVVHNTAGSPCGVVAVDVA